MMKASSAILLVTLVLTSCQRAAPVSSTSNPPDDSWQKMKDCTAKVESLPPPEGNANLQISLVSHYSRKYDPCFIRRTSTMPKHKPGPGEREYEIMLMDAFEGSIGATVAFVGPCYLGGNQADCKATEDFIADAMTN